MQYKRRGYLVLMLATIVGLLLSGLVQASPAQQTPAAAPIQLRAVTFTPAAGEQPALPPGLSIAEYSANQRGYYIVQFAGPVQPAWKDQVAAAGGESLDYIPDFAFKVRMTPAEAEQVAALDSVAWLGIFQPAYKLSPDLKRDGTRIYRVRVERGADLGLTTAALASSGAQVLDQGGSIVLVAANAAQLEAIANVLDVAWVENFAIHRKHTESGGGVILGAATVTANGYDGSTQAIAVADTGLGDGTAAGAHPDIPASRIAGIFDWTAGDMDFCYRVMKDGPQDADSGHGTHVAGSAVSDGDVDGRGQGVAPAARLVFQAVEEYLDLFGVCQDSMADGYYLIGIPDDLHQLFQQAYDAGARVHSNSWGSAQAGAYTLDASNADDFMWDAREMVVTFSAGNEGVDADADGVIDGDSMSSPATAKNVLTIGASESQRAAYPCDTSLTYTSRDAYQPSQTCSGMGGQNLLGSYGERWPANYPANPIAGDSTAGNQEQMAAFSSRGPADDGRIKPDVVAPGTWVLSTYAGLFQEGYGDPTNPQSGTYQMDGWGMPANGLYKYFGGTSMASPIAGGAAAVVRDYYQKARGINASAALVKATLINSAVDLLDENNDGVDDNAFPIPNVHEGWGRIDLVSATDGSHQWVEQTAGLSTGGSAAYTYIAAGGAPLKVSLVWTDYRALEAAAKSLVNDLDLIVTDPDGLVYRGNVFSGGWTHVGGGAGGGAGGSADRANNVENVYIPSAAAGAWSVQVGGYNVPSGPQPFALVVDGAAIGLPTPTPTPANPSAPSATGTPAFTATPAPAVNAHIGDLDGATSTARAEGWNATVTVTVHDSAHGPAAGSTVSGTWSGGAAGSATCTTDPNGQCTVAKTDIAKGAGSVTFTVGSIGDSGVAYEPANNHDPDGDSNGASITLAKQVPRPTPP